MVVRGAPALRRTLLRTFAGTTGASEANEDASANAFASGDVTAARQPEWLCWGELALLLLGPTHADALCARHCTPEYTWCEISSREADCMHRYSVHCRRAAPSALSSAILCACYPKRAARTWRARNGQLLAPLSPPAWAFKALKNRVFYHHHFTP